MKATAIIGSPSVWLVQSQKSAAELYLELTTALEGRTPVTIFVAEITTNAMGSYIDGQREKTDLELAAIIDRARGV